MEKKNIDSPVVSEESIIERLHITRQELNEMEKRGEVKAVTVTKNGVRKKAYIFKSLKRGLIEYATIKSEYARNK